MSGAPRARENEAREQNQIHLPGMRTKTTGRNPTLSCSAASVWPNISNCKLRSLNAAQRHDILLPGKEGGTRPTASR
jgi:hypothetical protein